MVPLLWIEQGESYFGTIKIKEIVENDNLKSESRDNMIKLYSVITPDGDTELLSQHITTFF